MIMKTYSGGIRVAGLDNLLGGIKSKESHLKYKHCIY